MSVQLIAVSTTLGKCLEHSRYNIVEQVSK